MKKFILLFLSMFTTLCASAYDYEYNGIYYNLDAVNQTATVTFRTTSYNSYSGNITIPETMIGPKSIQYTVVSIGDDAFNKCSNLSSITIPATVETIGARAFRACTNITTISIPNMVSSIGAEAFYGCTKLASATLPQNYLTSISEYLFYGCSSLETIQIPSTVTAMGNYAFQNCTKLASVSLSTRTQTIGNYTFSGCSVLANVTIPASVKSIGNYAFQNCSKLTSVNMSPGLETIGISAFRSCSLLPSVTLPNTVTSLGSSVFYGCSALNSVTLSTALTSLPDECFRNCTTLPAITIPALVTTISSSTFTGCSKLSTITFAEGMTSIPRSYATMVTTVNLPSTATTIVSQAFSGFSSLNTITFPASLTTIESKAFYGCSSLSSITLPPSLSTVESQVFYGCTALNSVTFPANLTTIENQAFYGCSALPRITIPARVASIGTDAFANCNNLAELTYAEGTRTALRTYATMLTKVIFPPSCFDFAPAAFSGCTALTSIYISDLEVWNYIFRNMASNPFACAHNIYVNNDLLTELSADFSPAINNYAFAGTKSLRSVIVGTGVTSIGTGAFSGCSDLQSFRGNDALTAIDSYAFSNCPALNTVRMGNHVTTIGSYAFSGCEGLTTLRLSPTVTSIGDYAFNNCYTLASINLPAGISAIRPYTFYNCRLLEDVEIPAAVTQVGDRAFYGCETLKTFTLSNAATSVGTYAFYGCSTLRNAYLGSGITSIGTYAFSKCSNLLGFYLSAVSVPSTGSNAFTDSAPTYINLYVPDGSLSAYSTASPWKDFIQHGLSEAPVYVRSITLNPEVVKLATSGTGTITATTSPSNATNSGVNWSSSNTGVVYVNSGGALMANAEGIATITARAKDAYGASAEAVVIVSDNFVGVSSLSLSSTTLTLAEGEEHHLIATVYPSSTTYKVVKWTSSNPDVVSVASDGQLTALSAGSATITAKSADGTNRTATCHVTVTEPSLPSGSTGPLTYITLEQESYTGVVGESVVVSTQKFPYRSSTTLTWRCDDSRVTLTPNASNGTCAITASVPTTTTITVSGNGLSATAELVIEPLAIICTSNMMAPRSIKQLTTNAASPVVWRSSDEDVATVNADGLVIAKCVGDVTITATSTTNPNLIATCPLYVRIGAVDEEWVVLSSVAYHSSDRYYIDNSPSFRKIRYTKNGTTSTYDSYSRMRSPSGTLYYFKNSGDYGILGLEGRNSGNVYCNANNVQTDANGYLVLDLQTVEQGFWTYESFQFNFSKNTVWMLAENYTTVNTYPDWTSTNTAHGSTSSHTYNINYSAGQKLSFDWSVSSESNYDWLEVTLDGTEILKKSGSESGTYTKTFTTSGTAVLVASYTKDNSNSSGSDQGKIYNISLMGQDPNWVPNPIAEHEYVDLGLPSGTLWATCNVGAATPDAYGDYFAWGEVAPKSNYNWSTYEHCNGYETTLTKYNTDSSYGTVDNRTELELVDDAAYVNWGVEWQMPNSSQEEELRSACTWTWTTRNGHSGYTVTGPNGNSIFLPAGGTKSGTSATNQGTGNYWINYSSYSVSRGMSLGFSSTAVYLGMNSSGANHYKYVGLSVRPVRRPHVGDVNNDGEVTIGDVIGTVNLILNTNTTGLQRSAADVNHDGTVTAADATGVINLVLGLPVDAAYSPRRAASHSEHVADVQLTIDPFTMTEGAENLVPVSLYSNDDEFTALQLDVLLPEGIHLANVLCDDDHMAAFAQQADGKMRIVVLSPDNVPFAGNGLAALTLQLAADADAAPGTVAVDAIEMARRDMSRVVPAAFSAAFGFASPTGIESVESTNHSPFYDIQGRRTAGAGHGIYVTQGRKVVK